MNPKRKSTWLKNRGYLHLTRQIDVSKERFEVLGKVQSKEFVAKHAFFPLLHTNIKVRRFKTTGEGNKRAHSINGDSNAKLRPLHYATHIDSMIFGYYAEKLQKLYLKELERTPHLSACVTAYRRIKHSETKDSYKSTIHFAHEVFEEIKQRATERPSDRCCVLKFDIEKFFSSMDHGLLKRAWANLLNVNRLPDDHYNVFKATTNFSYILRDDLRLNKYDSGRRSGFDEKNLAEIRKENISAFFRNAKDFRDEVKSGHFKIYKNQFKNSAKKMVGIPQGLPISATLANLYLLEFDRAVLSEVVGKRKGYYRRYSDDIIIICEWDESEDVVRFIDKILRNDSKVNISLEKTERYLFSHISKDDGSTNIVSFLSRGKEMLEGRPLTYLGFDFYGHKTLIKSANLSKFYRRMIVAVKSRTRRAALAVNKNPAAPIALFRRRLYRLYTSINLDKTITKRNHKKLGPNRFGYSVFHVERNEDKFPSNYFTYGRRAKEIMNEPMIIKQVRRHRTIFNQAVKKHSAYHLARTLKK